MLFVRDDFLGFTSRNKNKEPISLLICEYAGRKNKCGQRPTLTTRDTIRGMSVRKWDSIWWEWRYEARLSTVGRERFFGRKVGKEELLTGIQRWNPNVDRNISPLSTPGELRKKRSPRGMVGYKGYRYVMGNHGKD